MSTASVEHGLTPVWFDRPAATWLEALPVGNGRLGAMVFGGVAGDSLALNIDTLWSGTPGGSGIVDGPATLAEVRRLLLESEVGGGARRASSA